MGKKRGLFLTIILLLTALGYLSTLFYAFYLLEFDNVYGLLFALIGLIILFGILKWKKIAVYAFFLSQTLGLLLAVSTGVGNTPVITRIIISTLLSWVLWFYAIYREWKKFE